jgi:hypothetical protein
MVLLAKSRSSAKMTEVYNRVLEILPQIQYS